MPIVSTSFQMIECILCCEQANKLSTVKKCLNEVLKYGGPFNPRDLYPVSVFLFLVISRLKLISSNSSINWHCIKSIRFDKTENLLALMDQSPRGKGLSWRT